MLVLDHVHKIYHASKFWGKAKPVHAVKDLTLEIHPGAFGLLGVNGAGKTTTIKMLSTLLLPTSGQIFIDGLDIVRNANQARFRLNMIAGGERMLYYRLTGRENLLYFASLYNIPPREAARRVEKLLNLTGMSEDADRRVEQYSKGMKQRLSIARGLINNPEYLFLDEPTLGLDVTIAQEIRSFIKDLLLQNQGQTIILTSHYLDEIEEICPTLGILKAGQLVYLGTPQALYQKLGLNKVHQFKLKQPLPGGEAELRNRTGLPLIFHSAEDAVVAFQVRTDDEIAASVFATLKDLGVHHISYQVERPSLEDALIILSKQEETA